MSDCSTNAFKAKKPRNCPGFEYNPVDALTLDGIDDVFRAERERALYEKRMRGDWS